MKSKIFLLVCLVGGLVQSAWCGIPSRQARASSEVSGLEAQQAIDGRMDTRWSSDSSDPHWIEVDGGRPEELVGLRLFWEVAYASEYAIQVSMDRAQWQTVYSTTRGDGGEDDIDFPLVTARYVRVEGRRRGTAWGYSLFEIVPKTSQCPWGEDNPDGFFLKTQWPFTIAPTGEWGSITTHESWERQGFPTGGTGLYASTFFIPAEWTNAKPFIRLTDIRDDFELSINNRVVARNQGRRRVLTCDLSEALRYQAHNTVHLKVWGPGPFSGVLGSVVLARDEQSLERGLRSLHKTDPRKYYPWRAHIELEGSFPCWLTGRQGFWTTVGADEDFKESLLCQDGTLEPYKCFSISPFLYLENRLITRGEARLSQSLEKGFLPVPSATWETDDLTLNIQAFAAGPAGQAATYALYTVHNHRSTPVQGKLFLAMRPFEVNPPWQWGGFTRIHHIRREGNRIAVNEFNLVTVTDPTQFGATGVPEGDILNHLKTGEVPAKETFHDEGGNASAALEYAFDLPAQGKITHVLAIPLYPESPVVATLEQTAQLLQSTIRDWEQRLQRMPFQVPDNEMNDSLRAGLAHILVNRDGPAIQPGSRAYEAAWMRDGALTASALLKLGFDREVRQFLEWYETFQYDDGRIPAIVIIGRNEVNPVLELDSQGEWVAAVLEYYRFTHDKAFLKARWPSVLRALSYLAKSRAKEAEALKANTHDPQRYAGLLPQSVSHEGYYPEPGNHSYWDNFWALKGWKDAGIMARELGETNRLVHIQKEEASLREALYASIAVAMDWHQIEYIAGCAELGDFDPSSTAIAIVACDELEQLPQPALSNTFERYWQVLQQRQTPGWRGSFSPYEIRIAQAFQMMGDPARAKQVLDYLMKTQRPSGWRQWPEAVYFPEDQGGYIGDMPHTWVASGLICTLRAMFLQEFARPAELELAGGIPPEWSRQGVAIEDAPTWWGALSYSLKRQGNRIELKADGKCQPPKGFVVRLPEAEPIQAVLLNGKVHPTWTQKEIRFQNLPAHLVIDYERARPLDGYNDGTDPTNATSLQAEERNSP